MRKTRRMRRGQPKAHKMTPKPNRSANRCRAAVEKASRAFVESGKNRAARKAEKRVKSVR